MNYLLFIIYLVILCWLLLRMPFIKTLGIDNRVIIGLFLFKILAGIAIGWISIHIYGPGNDYWDVHDFALEEYKLLFTDPGKYFSNIFTSDYQNAYAGVFSSGDSYWNDLKGNIVIKMVSVFNIFSRGDYYINSLFFNFIIFFGHVILYRLFIKLYPDSRIPVIIGCFLLPSTIYFSSGIHKDGLVFLMMAVLIYCVYQSLLKSSITVRRLILIIISLVLLFLLRTFVFLALVPALFAWAIAAKTKWPAFITFTAIYVLSALIIFNINSVSNKIQPLNIIIARQKIYKELPVAATQIPLTALQPTFKSFAANATEALNHSLLRPYLWELPVKSLLPLAVELFIYQLLFLLLIFYRVKQAGALNHPFLFFAFGFTLTVLLMIGYIVPNLGTLVRYRSIYLPLIITPVLCIINWNKLATQLKIKK
ncbi:MAG: hypothetical protein WBP16_12335 [Ferruginibacter sp.]